MSFKISKGLKRMHILNSLERPIIFAHRGASRYAPENTMAAFLLAVKHGVKAIELDVMLTKDEIPIVMHDHLLDRTTNGTGQVNAQMFDSIVQLDAGSHFSPEFSGEKIPLLDQVLGALPKDLLINVELKNYHNPKDALVDRVIEIVEKHDKRSAILFSSFLPLNLIRVHQLMPDAKVGLLCSPGKLAALCRSNWYFHISPEFIHLHEGSVSKAVINKEHKRNRKINGWTVNNPARMRDLILWGIDGIITDDTLVAKQVIDQSH
jgi:glycerophosphoryl diester phosphodiesterase